MNQPQRIEECLVEYTYIMNKDTYFNKSTKSWQPVPWILCSIMECQKKGFNAAQAVLGPLCLISEIYWRYVIMGGGLKIPICKRRSYEYTCIVIWLFTNSCTKPLTKQVKGAHLYHQHGNHITSHGGLIEYMELKRDPQGNQHHLDWNATIQRCALTSYKWSSTSI